VVARVGILARMKRIAIAAAWITLACVFIAQEYVLARYIGRPMSLIRVILGVAPHYAIWALLAIAIVAVSRRFPLEPGRLAPHFAIHVAASLAFFAIDVAVSSLVVPPLLRAPAVTPFLIGFAAIRSFYDDFLLYWGIVGVTHLLRFQRSRAELQRAFTIAQLNALRAQLQPHFLFNTLNSIAELMHVDVAAAEQMIDSLSALLRCSLEGGERQEIVLQDELRMLDLYLAIQQVRFSDSVTIERDIDSSVQHALVPALLLQPLVENAFRHGIARRRGRATLAIRAARQNGQLRIEVRDDGAGLPAAVREGIGLRNTRERLAQLYGDAQSLLLENAQGGGARVVVTLPYRAEVPA